MPHLEPIPIAEPWLGRKERLLLNECAITRWVSSRGRFVGEFENAFASYCGVKYGVATCNGTSALHLALACLDIGPGHEVIVPTLSFIGTVNPVTYVGATPVFVDSNVETWNMDPEAVERVITRKTRAIIVVHLYGHPAHMDDILAIAKRHGIYVIEDACEAHGAEFRGNKVGSLGTFGCFSFFGNKIITTGEGGMLVTDQFPLVEKARMLRDHGMSRRKKYWHSHIGFNYRMTNLQGALGVAQMERIDQVIERKRRNARLYNSLLKEIPGIILPPEAPWARPVYWLYTVLIGKQMKISRYRIIKELAHRGIETRPVFYSINSLPPYHNGRHERFPVAKKISTQGLSLPSSPLLHADSIGRVCEIIKKLARNACSVKKNQGDRETVSRDGNGRG